MSDFNSQPNNPFVEGMATARMVDQGLRAHMLKVYNFMAGGLALTGLIAYFLGQALVQAMDRLKPLLSDHTSAAIQSSFDSPLMQFISAIPAPVLVFIGIGSLLAIIIIPLWLRFGLRSISPALAQALFWIYAASMGVFTSFIFLEFTDTSIVKTFLVTAGTFAAMSLWGYTTKRDLTGMGSFLMMGLIGLIIASVANIFFHSTQLEMIISFVGVLLFTALTAYDTQKIKNMYSSGWSEDSNQKLAIIGALQLYLDFINLFMYLLRFMGSRRN